MKIKGILKIILAAAFGLLLLVPQASLTSCRSERSANIRKAEKAKAKREKEARKEYEKAVKHHMDQQSKSTKAMMKESKKEKSKNTPLKSTSGKKCK